MKIGVFDSGTGGLNVLYEAYLNLGNACEFVYFADHKNVPYGTKNNDEILSFLASALNFLQNQHCDATIIACNTASSVANKEFREQFKMKIVAMEPAIKPAIENFINQKILITATNATINGQKLNKLLQALNATNYTLLALPKLVEFAQNAKFSQALKYLQEFSLNDYDIIVLGCTHFNYFKREIRLINPIVNFIDGNLGTIKELARKLNLTFTKNDANLAKLMQQTQFFVSNNKANDSQMELFKISLARAKMLRAIK